MKNSPEDTIRADDPIAARKVREAANKLIQSISKIPADLSGLNKRRACKITPLESPRIVISK